MISAQHSDHAYCIDFGWMIKLPTVADKTLRILHLTWTQNKFFVMIFFKWGKFIFTVHSGFLSRWRIEQFRQVNNKLVMLSLIHNFILINPNPQKFQTKCRHCMLQNANTDSGVTMATLSVHEPIHALYHRYTHVLNPISLRDVLGWLFTAQFVTENLH